MFLVPWGVTSGHIYGAFEWDSGLQAACSSGCEDIIKLMIKNGAKSSGSAFNGACEGGRVDLVKMLYWSNHDFPVANYFISLDRDINISSGFKGACENGHIGVIDLLLPDMLDLNEGFLWACIYGRVDVAKRLISNGALNLTIIKNKGFSWLRDDVNNLEIVNLLIDIGANSWNEGLRSASQRGDIEVMKLMISKGANDWSVHKRAKQDTNVLKLLLGKQ